MKVLTLIVSYNFEPWLRRCLDSVLASRGVAVSTALSMVTVPLLLSLI